GLLARLLRPREVVHAVRTRLDRAGNHLKALRGELGRRLHDPAVVQRVRVEPFDLGEDGLVVGFLRVKPVTPEDLHAQLARPLLEAVRDADAEGAAVVQYEEIGRASCRERGYRP